MHHEEVGAALFGQSFGRNVRAARERKGWSQRELASALQKHGLKLDPSAVTRIERGAREAKLREAVAIAECLSVDLRELVTAEAHDPWSVAIDLRRQAEACLHTGWVALAQFGILVQALTSLLEVSPPTRDNLSKLKDRPDGLDAEDLIGLELADMLQGLREWAGDSEVPGNERIADELQRAVTAAVDQLFTARGIEETSRHARPPKNAGVDAET